MQVYETTNKSLWRLFANHHYLSADLNNACKMYIATWNGVIVAMDSVLPIPSGTLKNGYREHRLVVLPDYQGLGIGTRLSNALGDYYISNGNKYFVVVLMLNWLKADCCQTLLGLKLAVLVS